MFAKEGFDYRVALYRVGIRMTHTILNLKAQNCLLGTWLPTAGFMGTRVEHARRL